MTQRPIKFRQRIDNQFHYWGFIDGKFIAPVESSSGQNPATTHHDEFTGLHDKNGVEIWEGDVVKFRETPPVWPPDTGTDFVALDDIRVVEWDAEGADFQMTPQKDMEAGRGFNGKQYIEVIGNVFENPELL